MEITLYSLWSLDIRLFFCYKLTWTGHTLYQPWIICTFFYQTPLLKLFVTMKMFSIAFRKDVSNSKCVAVQSIHYIISRNNFTNIFHLFYFHWVSSGQKKDELGCPEKSPRGDSHTKKTGMFVVSHRLLSLSRSTPGAFQCGTF